MLFEAIMGAMAFAASADKVSGNHPDYELEDKLQEEHDYKNFMAIKEHEDWLKKKFPKEVTPSGRLACKCTLFVPAYNKNVNCVIFDDHIVMDTEIKTQNGSDAADWISRGFSWAEYCERGMYSFECSPNLADHTKDIDKSIAIAMGHAVSWAIYSRDGKMNEAKHSFDEVNKLLKNRNIVFENTFDFYDVKAKRNMSLFEFIAKNIAF